MENKLFSLFFSILLISSVFSPVVNAAPPDDIEEPKMGAGPGIAVFAIPAVSKIVIDGLTVAIRA